MGNVLDHGYLTAWAGKLGVEEFLNRAIEEIGT
jgi:hypothetical protein